MISFNSLGINTPHITFHSFRHTLNTGLNCKLVKRPLRQELLGHDKRRGANEGYNDGFLITQLADAVNQADFTSELAAVVPF